jgi:DHA2 family multidrug resistance protein
MRNLGGAIGIAVCATILNDRTNLHFQRMAENLTPMNEAMNGVIQSVGNTFTTQLGDAAAGQTAAVRQLWLLTYREALTMTFSDAFLTVMVCFVIATAMVPLMRRVMPPKGPSADAH